jgi:hypothetical protein
MHQRPIGGKHHQQKHYGGDGAKQVSAQLPQNFVHACGKKTAWKARENVWAEL